MGIFDYLFRRRIYDDRDFGVGIIDNLPESDENTFVRTAANESVIIKNTGDSFEITILDGYDRIISKSVIKKKSIVSYDLKKYVELVSKFRNRYYECYDVVIESLPSGLVEIRDMYYEEAIAMYDFITKHLKVEK